MEPLAPEHLQSPYILILWCFSTCLKPECLAKDSAFSPGLIKNRRKACLRQDRRTVPDSRDLCPGILYSSHRHPSSASETHQLSQPPAKEAGNKQAEHVAGTCPRSGQALEGSSPPRAQHHRIRTADLGGVAKASSQTEVMGVYT